MNINAALISTLNQVATALCSVLVFTLRRMHFEGDQNKMTARLPLRR